MSDERFTSLYNFNPTEGPADLNEALRQIADSLFSISQRLDEIEDRLDDLEST